MLEQKLKELRESINGYYLHIHSMLENVFKAIIDMDTAQLEKIIKSDERLANEKELEIDEECIDFIALYSPRGKALRIALMILKMNNDFERIADHLVNIAECGLRLSKRPGYSLPPKILDMYEGTNLMLKDAFKSFLDEDAYLAKDVLKRDDIIDNLHSESVKDLIKADVKQGNETLIDTFIISSNLERIADLATNIAEDVIYIVEGKSYKHGHYTE
ncbi:MAG: phosphate signaling complex protein PhoU [candidate division WOR-3 bacterium]